MLRLLLIAAAAIFPPTIAAAQGYCLSEDKRAAYADRLDDYAKGDGAEDLSPAILACVLEGSGEREATPAANAAFRRRATTACTTIAARPTGPNASIVEACTDLLVENGTKKAGKVDLVERIFARPTQWMNDPTLRAVANTKDARARTWIIDAVRAALRDTAGNKFDNLSDLHSWIQFRLDALAALELVGTKADLKVVDDIAATIRNRKTDTGQKERDLIGPAVAKARAAMRKR